ncbi:scarecrow-like protein 6 [Euphorbia lathyris]|uniref:scarecrow-like protein 6 n=1 Tax=Euphorbia lathyris TaxID=212925 RepID=UPI0033143FFB
MLLPFEEFQGKGVFDFDFDFSSSSSSSSSSASPDLLPEIPLHKWRNIDNTKENRCYVGIEPTSVLDARRSSSPPTSSSTLSSSQGGTNGGGGGRADTTAGVSVDLKCGQQQQQQLRMEDWEGVLPGSPTSQEQSILRQIMGDTDVDEDPSLGFNKFLQNASQDMEFNPGFGVVDHGFAFENINVDAGNSSDFARIGSVFNQTPNFSSPEMEEKPQIFNPQMIINQNQAQAQFSQNPSMFLPLSYAQLQDHQHLLSPPPTKRLNSGSIKAHTFPESRPLPLPLPLPPPAEFFLLQNQLQMQRQQQKIMTQTDEPAQQLQQSVIHPICQAAELIGTGNPALAQAILARLNHQLSLSIGKPHIRAAYYFKEALQFLLHNPNSSSSSSSSVSPCNLIFKIAAFKSFSEISPILQFSNFTSNQALLEACDGFDRIHIIDFDIGYGGQWASLMQELGIKNSGSGSPSLKITAIASPNSDELELGFTQQSLKLFANEINIDFEIEIIGLESLNSAAFSSEKEVIAVNLPISPFSTYPSSLPIVLRFIKQLSPKIVVSLDRSCDRTDLPFAHHVNHCIQSYSTLIESIEAVNMNFDALQKIERFMIQPGIEKIVLGRHQNPERTSPWRSLFLQCGFTQFQFSNFAEAQAECLVQRTPVRGFHVEKKQASLVLCWQRKEIVSVSAWRC